MVDEGKGGGAEGETGEGAGSDLGVARICDQTSVDAQVLGLGVYELQLLLGVGLQDYLHLALLLPPAHVMLLDLSVTVHDPVLPFPHYLPVGSQNSMSGLSTHLPALHLQVASHPYHHLHSFLHLHYTIHIINALII